MSFLSGLIKRQVNPDTEMLAGAISQTFVQGQSPLLKSDRTPIICYGEPMTTPYNELTDLTRQSKQFDLIDPRQPLLEKVRNIHQIALRNQEFLETAIRQGQFFRGDYLMISYARNKHERDVRVIEKLQTFIQEHQAVIARLQRRKTEDPANYSKDLRDLTERGLHDVVAVLSILAESRLEEPRTAAGAAGDIDEDDWEVVTRELREEPTRGAAAGAGEPEPIKQPTAKLSHLSPAELQMLDSRPDMAEFGITDKDL